LIEPDPNNLSQKKKGKGVFLIKSKEEKRGGKRRGEKVENYPSRPGETNSACSPTWEEGRKKKKESM